MMKENTKTLQFLFILLLSLIISLCSKTEKEPIIARVGRSFISLSEFRDRYEFTPHIFLTQNKERNRHQVLISLLGEKILAEEAYHLKLSENMKFQTFSEQIENEAVVEALFEREVASKIQITDEEVKQGFILSQSMLDFKVLSFKNMQQAQQAKKQLDAGKSLNQVKQEFQTDTFISADSVLTLSIKWGESHPNIEKVAYQLKPNEISNPFEADGAILILKLITIRSNPLINEANLLKEAPSIRNKIKQRKRIEMLTDFMRSLMVDKKAKVSNDIFNFVAYKLEKLYPIKNGYSTSESMVPPMELSTDSLTRGELADHLSDDFVRFNDGSTWTVEDFVKKLSVGPYRLNNESSKSFRSSLRNVIRKMIEFESLAQKGRNLGLQNSSYVRNQTKMWDDAFLAQHLRKTIIDTVSISDSEVESYYDQNKNSYKSPALVNLQEILVDEETLAHQIYQQIKNGGDFAELARKYNKRELSKKADGEMGYFAPSALGKIGRIAQNLTIGEIGGPVKTEENQFSIFKLLDKKGAEPPPLKEILLTVKQDALSAKRIRTIDEIMVQLAKKYDVKIFESALDTLTTVDISMIVFKQHFPNRTIAPIITPLNNSLQWQKLISNKFNGKR